MIMMLNILINSVLANKNPMLETQISRDNIRRRMNKQPVMYKLTNLINNFIEPFIRAGLGTSTYARVTT